MDAFNNLSADKKISKMFTVARAVAILSVISAHTTIKTSTVVADLYSTIGSIGVVLFFIMAGYYYKKYPLMVLVKKKTVSIVLPWLVIGSVVWAVNSFLNSSSFAVGDLVLWLVGYKTYLYYVTVLLVCFALFYFNNIGTLILAIILNIASLALTVSGVLDPIIEKLHITNYLNVFNWFGFFAIGCLLKRINAEKLYGFIKKTRLIWILLSVMATITITLTGYKVGYFSPLGWAYELISMLSILGLCTFEFSYNKLSVSISEMSYAIYLSHLMFTGILAKIYGIHIATSLLANVIILVFIWLLLLACKFIAQKIKLGKIYNSIIGLRTT